jgi:hypothetical protein
MPICHGAGSTPNQWGACRATARVELQCDADYDEKGSFPCNQTRPHCIGFTDPDLGECRSWSMASNLVELNTDFDESETCRDTCSSAQDGVCSDGGLDSRTIDSPTVFACDYGTDCTDCGRRPFNPSPLCETTCTLPLRFWEDEDGDGFKDGYVCDDDFPGRTRMPWYVEDAKCGFGMQCAVCGPRRAVGVIAVPPYIHAREL